jgi:hypothetical protein
MGIRLTGFGPRFGRFRLQNARVGAFFFKLLAHGLRDLAAEVGQVRRGVNSERHYNDADRRLRNGRSYAHQGADE